MKITKSTILIIVNILVINCQCSNFSYQDDLSTILKSKSILLIAEKPITEASSFVGDLKLFSLDDSLSVTIMNNYSLYKSVAKIDPKWKEIYVFHQEKNELLLSIINVITKSKKVIDFSKKIINKGQQLSYVKDFVFDKDGNIYFIHGNRIFYYNFNVDSLSNFDVFNVPLNTAVSEQLPKGYRVTRIQLHQIKLDTLNNNLICTYEEKIQRDDRPNAVEMGNACELVLIDLKSKKRKFIDGYFVDLSSFQDEKILLTGLSGKILEWDKTKDSLDVKYQKLSLDGYIAGSPVIFSDEIVMFNMRKNTEHKGDYIKFYNSRTNEFKKTVYQNNTLIEFYSLYKKQE